jgi:peroxiredoxin
MAILILAFILAAGAAHAAPRELIGRKAPLFSGKQPSGAPLSLDSYIGKVPVILTFWSIYCKSCTEEMASLQKLYDKHGAGKMSVIAVNEDGDVGLTRVNAFLERFAAAEGGKLSLPILFDEKSDVFQKFGVVHMPTLIYIDKDGTVREVIEGFENGRELAVVSAIEKLIASTSPAPLKEIESEAVFDFDAVSPICGKYRDGKWYQPLDLDESRADSLARARSQGEDYLRREAVRRALFRIGVTLNGEERAPTCYVRYGLELRTPQYRRDALDLFIERLNLPRVVEVVNQETIERDRDLQLYRRIKIALPVIREQLDADGFTVARTTLRIRFARATQIEEKAFIESLSTDFPYLSSVKADRSTSRDRAEYVLVAHTSAAKAVEELAKLNVGPRKLSADLLAGNIVEVSMWR